MSSKKYSNKQKRKQDYESESEEEDQYEVEKILDSRINPKTKQKEYFVKWENWPIEDSTWEPVEHLQNVKEIVANFERNLKKKEVQNAPSSAGQSSGPLTRINAMKDASKKRGLPMTTSSTSKSLPHEEEIPTSKEDNKKQPIKKFQAASSRRTVSSQSESNSQAEDQQESSRGKNDGFEDAGNNAENEETELVFEEIIQKRDNEGQTEYLIRFQNIPQPQWVDVTQLIAIKDDVMAFEDKLAKEASEKAAAAALAAQQQQQQQSKSNKISKENNNNRQASSQHQNDPSENDELEVDDQKDSKRKNLVPLSKRPTAKRSQPFAAEEEKEKPQVQNSSQSSSKVVEKEQQLPVSKAQTRLGQQQSALSQSNASLNQAMTTNSSSTSLELQSKMNQSQQQQQHQKRKPIELCDVQLGDFKTDNVDRIELQGDFNDILTARFEVFWKIRNDHVTPASQIYSASYLRRYEPQVLIDYLLNHTQQHQQGNSQVQIR